MKKACNLSLEAPWLYTAELKVNPFGVPLTIL